jgi:hypothetical protein
VGKKGPILLQDWVLIDKLSHFSRERIPERVVHAKGAGAFGYFEVTHDITQYTAAKVFSKLGKKTPVAVRFSQVAGEMGSADTVRDVRGFAWKFYTEDGTWDLVGNNTPIFFIRDAILFPSFIHILKRNPVTHLRDWDMFWDMMSLRPETTHQLLIFFSDRGKWYPRVVLELGISLPKASPTATATCTATAPTPSLWSTSTETSTIASSTTSPTKVSVLWTPTKPQKPPEKTPTTSPETSTTL